jgi:serine/threonine-protein kinase
VSNQIADGRYRIDRQLGLGVMGVLLEAHDLQARVPVALRVLRPPHAQNLVEKLSRLAGVLDGEVAHPGVVPLLDVGVDLDSVYYTMPLLTGRSLDREVLSTGPLDAKRARDIFLLVADAVAALHAAGLIHAVLKPGSIFLSAGVLLLEPGVQALVGGLDWPAPGVEAPAGFGTPQSRSSEQAVGSALDERTDIFALGSALYQALTAMPPFGGDISPAVMATLGARPPRPSDRMASVPDSLDNIVLRAMARQPEDRYASVAELRRALEGLGGDGA